MKITITNKCKEYILNAENGIKFQVKGYAFLVDNERILAKKGADVQLKNLYRKNPTEEDELIVLNPLKNSNQDILYRLFDTTYVPATELKTTDNYPFGTYKFRFDQGLNPNKKGGFCCADYNCSQFDAILVIGQKFDEYPTYVKEEERSFLAAYITPENDNEKFKLDNLYDTTGTGPVSRVISWVFSLGEFDESPVKVLYDEDYKDLMKNYSLKDNQTTMIRVGDVDSSKKNALFLVQSSSVGTQYDEVINNLELNQGFADNFSGTYVPTNIILTDETEKVNNLWNVKPAITIFDDHNSPIAKPQMMLSYSCDNDLTINSLAITYSKDTNKQVFSINDVTGNDTIQANLFPEDLHEENKYCVDPEYKPYNNTVVSAWSAEKNNTRFFKLHSNGGHYIGFHVYNTFELSSKGNNLSACSSNTFYVSNYNTLNKSVLSEFIHSNNNNINLLSNASFIDSHNVLFNDIAPQASSTPVLTGHTLIGVNGEQNRYLLYSVPTYMTGNVTAQVVQGSYSNYTHIGTNKFTQFYNDFGTLSITGFTERGDKVQLPILNDTKHIKGKVTVTAASSKSDTTTGKQFDRPIELDINYNYFNENTQEFDTILNLNNFALIGHEGLLASRAFYKDWAYPGREYEGYSNSLKKGNWVLTGTPTGRNPNDFTIVFGNYNSLLNTNKSSPRLTYYYDYATSKGGIYDYYRSYINDGLVLDSNSIVSSIYNSSNTYDCNYINYPFFINQQDNAFCKVPPATTTGLYYAFRAITTDEGDYSLNKLLVVGGGEGYTDNIQDTIFSPAENVSKEKHYYEVAKRIDVFSIEKDSYQLVHNNTYDLNPSLSATKVGYIPGMFAVRGWEKPVQKYHYRYTSAYNGKAPSGVNIISASLVTSPNTYNLQNTIYTPTGMLIPLIRSSNDGYKLNIEHINDYIKGSTITGISKRVNFTNLQNKYDEFIQKRYTFVYKTPGVCTVTFKKGAKGGKGTKGTKGTKGYKGSKGLVKGRDYTVDWRYRLYIDDLFNGLNTKGIKLRGNGVKGIKSRVYTIYLVNENKKHTITFKGIRMRKVGAKYQTLMTTRYIHPGMTQRIMFVDNGANGQYGVMNFNYYNENNDSFMTR